MNLKKVTNDSLQLSEEMYWLMVSPREAHDLIISLTGQLKEKNPNGGRLETTLTDPHAYFTIAVEFDRSRGMDQKATEVTQNPWLDDGDKAEWD